MAFALFSLWTFVLIGRPQDLIQILAVLRPALVLAVLTLGVVFFGKTQSLFESVRSKPEARLYLIFFAIMIVGIPFAYHRRIAFNNTLTVYLVNLLFFFLFVTLVDSVARLKKILWVVTLCAFLYGLFGLLKGTVSAGRFRITGSMFDPNDIAYVLVSLLPLSLLFIVRSEGAVKKILALAGAGASLIVILLTGSRAGFLGLAAVLVLALLTQSGSIKLRYKILLIAGVALVAMLNFERINVERYLTLTDMEGDYNVTSPTGRIEIWKKAIELLQAHPITGVGVQCFPMAIGYLRADLAVLPVWQAVHNSYLQIAVETGVFGFGLFITLVIGSLRNFWSCARNLNKEGDEIARICGFLQLAFVGNLFCGFFLSQGYSIFFTLFFALSASIRNIVRARSLSDAADRTVDRPVKWSGLQAAKGREVATAYTLKTKIGIRGGS
jgi:O-antigen ligase